MDDMMILAAALVVLVASFILFIIGFRREMKALRYYQEILTIKEE